MANDTTRDDLSADLLLARLRQIVWNVIDERDRESVDIDSISAETELANLPLDSLATIELMYAIEETFNVSLTEEEAFELQTVGQVIQHIAGRRVVEAHGTTPA
jgi:acyl carrier protein